MFKIGIIASAYKVIAAFLLDLFPNAAAAYSLRKLRTAYTGSAIRVRRSSDNTEQDIGFSGANLDETALTTFVGSGNMFTYSEQFDNAIWTKSSVSVTANTLDTLDPFGGNTSDKVIENTGGGIHGLGRLNNISVDMSSGKQYTLSIYLKSGSRTIIFIEGYSGAGYMGNAKFNLITGTIISSTTTATITDAGNGWWRCSISGTTNLNANHTLYYYLCDAAGNTSYTGNGTGSIYFWGAQLNAGLTAQTYVQTVANQAGFGFVTKWYDQGYTGAYNFFIYSEQFDNAAWSKNQITATANQTTAPDGNPTADLLAETAITQQHTLSQPNPSVIAGRYYTISMYLKKGSGATAPDVIQMNFQFNNFGTAFCNFNINTGIAGTATNCTATIRADVDGWYRCSITALCTTSGSTVTALQFCNNNIASAVRPSYLGQTTSNVFAWGSQFNEGISADTYVQTVATAILPRDAVQTTAANQPRVVNAGVIEKINGKPNINFGASTSSINMSADFNGASSASIFTVVNVNTISVALQGDNNTKWYGAIWPGNTNTTVYQNAGTPSFYKNGSLLTLTTQSALYSSLATGQILFTALPLNTSTWTQINTNLAGETNYGSYANRQELIIYNSDQSTNRTSIESNINSYYTIY